MLALIDVISDDITGYAGTLLNILLRFQESWLNVNTPIVCYQEPLNVIN